MVADFLVQLNLKLECQPMLAISAGATGKLMRAYDQSIYIMEIFYYSFGYKNTLAARQLLFLALEIDMDGRTLEKFSRQQLARLGREYMLSAQFNSRTGYAALRMNHGDEAYKEIAIANWMAVSPVYTQRMQKAMGFHGGSDIATIFKGLQLECGLTHQYFDAHFEVFSEDKGRFWLKSCGPLLETEPRGDEAVKVMCHDIEDPTFDATAVATNPKARMRPVHRPPRMPDHQGPHCEWNVFVDHDAEPLTEIEVTKAMRRSKLAKLDIKRPVTSASAGMDYYDGSVFEQLRLEQLSHAALVVVCKELGIQCQMLTASMMMVITERYGRAAAEAVAAFQMTGSAWVMSNRLLEWLDTGIDGIDRVIDVLAVHPAFQPAEYIGLEISKIDERRAQLVFKDCPAQTEMSELGWFPLLMSGVSDGLEGLIKGIDPKATLLPSDDQAMAWDIVIDESLELADEPLSVQIAKGTVLYKTRLSDHIQLLESV